MTHFEQRIHSSLDTSGASCADILNGDYFVLVVD